MGTYQAHHCDDKPLVDTPGLASFGKDMRKNHFLFADDYVNLNQGLNGLN